MCERSAALLQLSLEHFGAIVVLLQNQLNGSAAALMRLQYEALIRGMYFYQCASESEAERLCQTISPADADGRHADTLPFRNRRAGRESGQSKRKFQQGVYL